MKKIPQVSQSKRLPFFVKHPVHELNKRIELTPRSPLALLKAITVSITQLKEY